ncbi:MAG: hypothetical protein Q8O67_02525 [Deltaproteobacteria bacterium]|nr:hypothetical protein [Deltaproteobacteria bacterium]
MLLFALALAAQPIVIDVQGAGCSNAEALAVVVNGRAGAGSVVVDGSRVVEVLYVSRAGTGFSGTAAEVKLVVDGVPRGQRKLGPFEDCRALEDALALTLALIVDPLLPPEAPKEAVTTSTAAPELRVVVRERGFDEAPLRIQGLAGVGVGGGLAPGFGLSGLLRLQFKVDWLGIGLGARLDLPGPLVVDGKRRLESGAAAAVVDGCFVGSLSDVDVEACVVVETGALRSVGVGFTQPDPTVAEIITGGAALGVNVPLWGGLGLNTRLGLSTPLQGARLRDGGGDVVWESPQVAVQWLVGISAEPARSAPREGRSR